ncbi:hypothetical protein Bbelb_314910 [Branchiostoma belcheri]|nr:hypothetical protein Bbelb_314910 [Branchiostoma belcheri]
MAEVQESSLLENSGYQLGEMKTGDDTVMLGCKADIPGFILVRNPGSQPPPDLPPHPGSPAQLVSGDPAQSCQLKTPYISPPKEQIAGRQQADSKLLFCWFPTTSSQQSPLETVILLQVLQQWGIFGPDGKHLITGSD